MSTSFSRLLPLFERERSAGRTMVLATVIRTAGPTYTKPGALMLIARNGEFAGLLSGGCLEGDLREQAAQVRDLGAARFVSYDMRGPDDLLFGLGTGCEGAMDILLQPVSAAAEWQPLARLAQSWRALRTLKYGTVLRSSDPQLPTGTVIFADGAAFTPRGVLATKVELETLQVGEILRSVQLPPTRLLLLGAGPDAQPVAQLAHFLGWSVLVFDHRPAYANSERFPTAERIVQARPQELTALLATERFAAAVVMSHHYQSDLAYLRVLAASPIGYIGLLGPAVRRERLLAELGVAAGQLESRLHGPVGLRIGAASPEAIALAIVAEIHAHVAAGEVPATGLSWGPQ
jgi:xanthine/CO dehydrogenase XdhC/CoxF family maturation factor